MRAELDVGAYGGAERLVVGEARFVESFEVERDEAVTLLVCDLAMVVDFDDVRNADVADPDMVVGPLLSRGPRVLLVARTDRLAQRETVSLEDFADHPVPTTPRSRER